MQKSARHKAQYFMEPVRAQMREAFTNTGDTEQVGRHFEATRPSTQDVVMAGHEVRIDELTMRLALIEAQLGLRKPVSSARPYLLRRAS